MIPLVMRAAVTVAALACVIAVTATAAVTTVPQRRPTFVEDVAPILHANCASCHHPDGAAPFALLSYDDARAKGSEIKAAVSSRRMPPWSPVAASGYPGLRHDRRLAARQIQTITAWVDQGLPPGHASKMPLPPIVPASWQLGLPDLTMSLPRTVPLPGSDLPHVVNVVAYLNFPTDRWIRAIDYRPSNRGVLSHAVFFVVPALMVVGETDVLPGYAGLLGGAARANPGEDLERANRSVEPIAVWAPEMRLTTPPAGTALKLPKGTSLVMQLHAPASDTGAIEDGTIAIYFEKSPPATPLVSLQLPQSLGIAAGIDIPAGDKPTIVRDEFVLPADVTAFGARGHAHALGRDLKLTARLPNGTVRGLLWIDRWSVRWQESYYFTAPVRLPKGTRLTAEITYGPSARRVVWGPGLAGEVGAVDLIIGALPPGDATALTAARELRFREQLLKVQGRTSR